MNMAKAKKPTPRQPQRALPAPAAPVMARPPVTRKLDLGAGQRPREGFEGVDIWPGAQHQVNLQKFPWPFEDNSVSAIHCSHYIEHIPHYPMVITADGREQNPFFAFFDEVWRILVPDGFASIIAPSARSNRGFQDPTHQRFIVGETFLYLVEEWRKINGLDHYNAKCNFLVSANATIDSNLNTFHPDVQQRMFNNYWNTTIDWVAELKAIKPGSVTGTPDPLPKLPGTI